MHPFSSNARRATVTAALCELPVEKIVVALDKGEHLRPEFLAMNPNHKVPTLVDGELTLWESNAIAIYLAGRAGRTDLWPVEPGAQADVARWLMWTHSTWTPAIGTVVFERMVKAWRNLPPDEAKAAEAVASFGEHAKLLDAHLAQREWVAQDRLTLADISLAATFMHGPKVGLSLDGFANVAAWYQRVQALPAWQATEAG